MAFFLLFCKEGLFFEILCYNRRDDTLGVIHVDLPFIKQTALSQCQRLKIATLSELFLSLTKGAF